MSGARFPTNVHLETGKERPKADLLRFVRCVVHVPPFLLDEELIKAMGQSKTRAGAAKRVHAVYGAAYRTNSEVLRCPGICKGTPRPAPPPGTFASH